jgi:hypothetical protein
VWCSGVGRSVRGNERKEVALGLIAFHRELKMERGGKEGERARRSPGRRRFKQKKKEGAWEEGESDRWGRPVSSTKKKRKVGGEVGRCEERSWAGGAAGVKGKGR